MALIYIVGYTYSGKTTFGRALAESRNMQFIDLDQAFEQRYHYTISRFMAQFGEVAFRQLETKQLHDTSVVSDAVIATGGGTPCYADNMDFMLARGTVVYLQMDAEQLFIRATASHNPRPLLRKLSPEQLREHIASQLKEREAFYLRAPIVVDGLNPDVGMVSLL